jgi:hypothetical protein
MRHNIMTNLGTLNDVEFQRKADQPLANNLGSSNRVPEFRGSVPGSLAR